MDQLHIIIKSPTNKLKNITHWDMNIFIQSTSTKELQDSSDQLEEASSPDNEFKTISSHKMNHKHTK